MRELTSSLDQLQGEVRCKRSAAVTLLGKPFVYEAAIASVRLVSRLLNYRTIWLKRSVLLLTISFRSPKSRTTFPITKRNSKRITKKSSSFNQVPREMGQHFFSARIRRPPTQIFEQKCLPNQLSISLSHDTSTLMILPFISFILLPSINSSKPIGKIRAKHQ